MYFFYTKFEVPKKIECYKFFFYGQDSLECLFSRVRSMTANNTNPTVQQLFGVLRQKIVLSEIEAPLTSNVEDNLNILTVTNNQNNKNISNRQIHVTNDDCFEIFSNLNLNYKDIYSIKLRAGTIEKKIRRAIPRCDNAQCKNIFTNNSDKIDGSFFENGLAQRPTKSTVAICEIVYKYFLIYSDIFKFNYNELYAQILNEIPFNDLYLNIDFSHNAQHKSEFILLIIDEYIRLHATYLARTKTLEIHSKYFGKTKQKLKHFHGQ